MGKENMEDLLKMMQPFPEQTIQLILFLRAFVWDLYPGSNELIYNNYNALAVGWSPTDRLGHTFCSTAVMRSNHNVHFGFYWGSQIADPEQILLGKGNQYRYILVKDQKSFPKTYIKKLVKDAYTNSLAKVKDPSLIQKGLTIVKSVSAVQRKPGVKTVKKK